MGLPELEGLSMLPAQLLAADRLTLPDTTDTILGSSIPVILGGVALGVVAAAAAHIWERSDKN